MKNIDMHTKGVYNNTMSFNKQVIRLSHPKKEPKLMVNAFMIQVAQKVPSVTTILGRMKDMTGINKWRDRVGHEEAQRILTEAAKFRYSNT